MNGANATEADSSYRDRTQLIFNLTDIPSCSKSGGCLLLLRIMRRGELLFLLVFMVSLPAIGQVKNNRLEQLMEGYVGSDHFNGTVLVGPGLSVLRISSLETLSEDRRNSSSVN